MRNPNSGCLHAVNGGNAVHLPASNPMKNVAQDGKNFYALVSSDFSIEHLGTGNPPLTARAFAMRWSGPDRSLEDILGVGASNHELLVFADDQVTAYAQNFWAHADHDLVKEFSQLFPIREGGVLKVARVTYGLYGRGKVTASKYPLSTTWSGSRGTCLVLAEVRKAAAQAAASGN